MKTVFNFTGKLNRTTEQRLERILQQIQSLLNLSSDIFLMLNERDLPDVNTFLLPKLAEAHLKKVLLDTQIYLSFFDYMTEDTFRMIATDTDPGCGWKHMLEAADHTSCGDSAKDYHKAAFEYGMCPESRKKFDEMICRAFIRRLKREMRPEYVLEQITGDEERFPGEAQCLRDRDLQSDLLSDCDKDLYWEYITVRRELFEYHDIFPDEYCESEMILEKLIRFSRVHHIDRSYYCDAVDRMIISKEWDKARMLTEEGLYVSFPDSEEDRESVRKLHYYMMILAENAKEAAMEADLLQTLPCGRQGLLWDYEQNSCAVASGEAYYRNGEYEKAWKAIERQVSMIEEAMEGGEPVDLYMEPDEQFRTLLLRAELLKIKCASETDVISAYSCCLYMIRYISGCDRKQKFRILTGITSADEKYIHEQMKQETDDHVYLQKETYRKNYTAMYC